MGRFRELFAVIAEATINAIERTHALDFVVGLSTHAGILHAIGDYLGGPYGALGAIVAASCIFTIAMRSLHVRKQTATPPLSPPRSPRAKGSLLNFSLKINYPPKPPKPRGRRPRKKKPGDDPPGS